MDLTYLMYATNSLHIGVRYICTILNKVQLEYYLLSGCIIKRQLLSVDLSHTGVTNVNALAGVHTINLSHTGVTNVNALTGVHTIDLRNTQVTNVKSLIGVRRISLQNTPIADVNMCKLNAQLDYYTSRIPLILASLVFIRIAWPAQTLLALIFFAIFVRLIYLTYHSMALKTALTCP